MLDLRLPTALHEVAHWTGHPSRLDRDLAHPFGSEAYAREELRAEIASMILGEELGIGHDPGQHAAYVGSWIKAIKDDPLEIFRAAADAEKIQSYVLGLEQQYQRENHQAVQVAQFLAENVQLSPQQVIENTQAADRDLKTILSDASKMAVIETRVQALLQSVHRGYIDEVKQAITAVSEQAALTLTDKVVDHTAAEGDHDADLDDAQMVAEFIAENLQLERADVATNMAAAAPVLRSLLADQSRLQALDKQVDQLLHGLNQASIEQTQSMIAATLGRGAVGLARASEDALKNDAHAEGDALRAAAVTRMDAEQNISLQVSDVARRSEQELASQRTVGHDALISAQSQSMAASMSGGLQVGNDGDGIARGSGVADGQRSVSLAVPYEDSRAASTLGAVWDKSAGIWSAGPDADLVALARWRVVDQAAEQKPILAPRAEFSAVLQAAGCVMTEPHPLLDGVLHRISMQGGPLEDERLAGVYMGRLDGHPEGYFRNESTGTELTWHAKGYALSASEKAQLYEVAAEKLAQRDAAELHGYTQAAELAVQQLETLQSLRTATSYMHNLGLEATPGLYTDAAGAKLFIPAMDVTGKQWTTQTIDQEGHCAFFPGSRKAGCFHAVGRLSDLADAPALVITTDYATANVLARSLGHTTVAALESSNLSDVALALHQRYPHKPVIIAGERDPSTAVGAGPDKSRADGQQAAALTGGLFVEPIFAPGESHSNGKRYSSFVDLAQHSALGLEGLERQIRSAEVREVEKAQEASQIQSAQSTQAKAHGHRVGLR